MSANRFKKSNRRRRRGVREWLRRIFNKTTTSRSKKYIRKNHLAFLGPGVALLICYYVYIVAPDIRYVATAPGTFSMLERKVDANGNLVYYFRVKPRFKNVALKRGFIDRVEIVPLTIATLPETRVTSIDKTPIGWNEQREVEILFLITLPTDALNNLNRTKEVSADVVFDAFDNTGKKVNKFPNGMYARILMKLGDSITVKSE